MSLQEIQHSHLDSAKEMFACGLIFFCITVAISRFESLTQRLGVFHKQCPQLWSNWGPWPHWRYAKGLYGVFGKLEET